MMSDNNISEDGKVMLTGRIYPAIQNCVNNRYKIILGYFLSIAFVLSNKFLNLPKTIDGSLIVAVIFTIFVFINSTNYWLNAKAQWDLESTSNGKIPTFDLFSSFVILVLIWGTYFII